MRTLIVHAHHEPASFSAALSRAGAHALREAGHEVIVSDLYAQAFDPVSDRRNFTTRVDAARLDQQAEEAFASANGGYVAELQREMDRLAWCDALVLQFPLWWLGMPAILKGWVDRVFSLGRAYGGGRYFSRGVFAGKIALCAVTVGGSGAAYSAQGAYGPMDAVLFPIHHGILGFTGFDVAEPFIVHGPARMTDEARRATIGRFGDALLSLAERPRVAPLDISGYTALVRATPN